jgi:hypothetical protein
MGFAVAQAWLMCVFSTASGSENLMEKTIFLFQRHRDRTREDFARHYINAHAPLGARLTRSLLGYTVNLVENEPGPDAITEHWLAKATDLLTPDIAYATREDFDAVVADDRTLFSDSVLHVVVAETYPITAELKAAPLGTQTPEIKAIWLYADASKAPPPPTGARRVVDNRVGYKLVFENGKRNQVAPDYELIRMAWADNKTAFGDTANAIIVKEYRFITAPHWQV